MLEPKRYLTIGSLAIAIAGIGFINTEQLRAQTPLYSQNSTPPVNNSVSGIESASKAVLEDTAKRTGTPLRNLKIAEIKRQTWSDGCLGLPDKDSVCTQALVNGWRLVVTDDRQNWVYRTNLSGSLIKLDPGATATANNSSNVAVNPEEEDNPAILPDPKPVKLPLRIVDVSSATRANGKKPTALLPSPKPVRRPQPSATLPPIVAPPTNRSSATIPVPKPTPDRTARPAQLIFKDVPKQYWARDFIAELAQRDIIKGSGNRFRPSDPVTNAEFAAMLSLAFPRPNVRGEVDFADITPKEWAHSYLLEAYQRGFLEVGSNNKIYPNRQVSRLNVLTALTRGLKYTPNESATDTLKIYRDSGAIAPEFRDVVAAATEKGLVVNYPNTKMLKPNRRATRAEVAALIYQAMVSTGQVAKLDSPYIVLEPGN